jgi:hypothetical protein
VTKKTEEIRSILEGALKKGDHRTAVICSSALGEEDVSVLFAYCDANGIKDDEEVVNCIRDQKAAIKHIS